MTRCSSGRGIRRPIQTASAEQFSRVQFGHRESDPHKVCAMVGRAVQQACRRDRMVVEPHSALPVRGYSKV